jgi:site-specific DNA-methyltransferase (adenine-specific)
MIYHETEHGKLYLGFSEAHLPNIESQSIDMILCDLPYGTTACKWDVILPFDELWKEYKRIIKDNKAIALTASQPFTSELVCSNLKWFRHEWIYVKSQLSNFLSISHNPMKEHENIIVFSSGSVAHKKHGSRMEYNPQGLVSFNKEIKQKLGRDFNSKGHRPSDKERYIQEFTNYPKSIIFEPSVLDTIHPTQKPVALYEYLIRTYTNEGETVLDICMGSGTTGVACKNTGRNFIGIEKDPAYFEIAKQRM